MVSMPVFQTGYEGSIPFTCSKLKIKNMEVLIKTTIRDLVKEANTLNIKKENIVTLLKVEDQYILIYYRK